MLILEWGKWTRKKPPEKFGFNFLNWVFKFTTPLSLMIASLLMSTLFTLIGHSLVLFAKIFGALLLAMVVTYFFKIVKRLMDFPVSTICVFILAFTAYLYLVTRNYNVVVYGGQDPGYYQDYAKLLSRGFGANFNSSYFEDFRSSGTYQLWSTNNTPSVSEIQFYPLMPAILSLLIPFFSSYSYCALSIFSSLFIVFFLYDYLLEKKSKSLSYVPILWLFVPATIWFSRLPASEILSVPLFVVAIICPLRNYERSKSENSPILLLSMALILCRANPMFPVTLIATELWFFFKGDINSITLVKLSKRIFEVIVAVILSIFCYIHFQPSLWKILAPDYRRPTEYAVLLLFAASTSKILFALNEPARKIQTKFLTRFQFQAFSIAVFSVFISINLLVLYSQKWGVYTPKDFGIDSSIIHRLSHTPLWFVLSSFGFSLLIMLSNHSKNKSYFLGLFGLFIVATSVRSPGIPYSYYFQRYWWSEVGVIVLLLLVDASLGSGEKKQTEKSNLITKWLVFLTILMQVLLFDITLTNKTETGSETFKSLQVLAKDLGAQKSDIVFSSDTPPDFTSAVVVPLRYYFGLHVSRVQDLVTFRSTNRQAIFIQSIPCRQSTEVIHQAIPVYRLRGVGNGSLGQWYRFTTQVYVCRD